MKCAIRKIPNLVFPNFNWRCYFSAVSSPRLVSNLRCSAICAAMALPAFAEDWHVPLADRGVSMAGSYIGEGWANVRGGMKRAATYDGLLTLHLDVDLEKLVGWKDAIVHAEGYYPHGAGPTQELVGDLSVVSNIDFYDSTRLFTLWIDQQLLDHRVSLRAGILAVDDEFAYSNYASALINGGFGAPSAQSVGFPLPVYAIAAPGIRLRVEPRDGLYVQVAAYDGNPAPGFVPDPSPDAAISHEDNHYGTGWALRSAEGAFLIGEIGVSFNQPSENADTAHDGKAAGLPRGLMGEYKLGFGWHTDTFSNSYDATLIALGSSLAPNQARGVRGNSVFYFVADQELWREPETEAQGLGTFLRATFVPPGRNPVCCSVDAGLHYTGLLPRRDRDVLALGVSYLGASREVKSAVRAANLADDAATAVPDYEVVAELTYQCEVRPGWTVQPDLQWIAHPGGSKERRNALVIGLRTSIEF